MSHDRISASVIDASETMELVAQLGFRLIVLDCGLDTGARHTNSCWHSPE